ncbi:vWA domain-containing protein [Saccharicrinis aurantiacus]|uniref:vWA domain-containing protein n=1 Tax=Saccharicrinis aurantiacus TaxID=1849719 RepID=UPI00248F81D4|nr:VWA domain-containing protein [Saccharicrinis aurantiacus]
MIALVLYKPIYLSFMPLVGILLFLYLRASVKRSKALKILFPHRKTSAFERPKKLRNLKISLILSACALLIFALAQPAWNLKTDTSIRQGKDIVILLDVSRSMLAEDMKPNRLEASKQAIIEFAESLEGDRIALVVFAGASQIACPLTYDYNFFKSVVQDVDWQSANVGGTYISTGMERVCNDLLETQKQALVDVLLLSDGGDMGKLDSLGQYFLKNQINLVSIGVGNANIESLIPETDADKMQTSPYVQHHGEPVKTALEPEALKQIAKITKGAYEETVGKTINLINIYQQHKNNAQLKSEIESDISSFKEQFQWFIALALLLVLITLAISKRKGHQITKVLIPFFILSLLSCNNEQNKIKQLNKSAQLSTNQEAYILATNDYKTAYEQSTHRETKAALAYNVANCLYQQTFHIEIDIEEDEEFDIDELKLQLYNESLSYYKIALELNPKLKDAIFNYEVVKQSENELLAEIEKQNQLQDQMNDPVKEILKVLTNELQLQQKHNNNVTWFLRKKLNKKQNFTQDNRTEKLQQFAQTQLQYSDTTSLILQLIWNLETALDSIHNVLQIQFEQDTIHKIAINKMDSTFMFQQKAAKLITSKKQHNLSSHQRNAAKLIQETIDYFNSQYNQDPNMPEGQQESDEEGESEESDQESESDFAEAQSEASVELSSMDEVEGFPPPNDNAQDVLKQEQKNNESRSKKPSKYKSTEMDW